MATVNLGRLKPVFKGAYNSGTAYVIDDIVTYANETYINIQAGTNQQPNTATGYWTKLAAKGTDGTDVGATLTTQGDILIRNGSGLARLGYGTAGQVLQTGGSGANPSWVNASGGKTLAFQNYQQNSRVALSSSSSATSLMSGAFTQAKANSKLLIHYKFVFFNDSSGSSRTYFTYDGNTTYENWSWDYRASSTNTHTWAGHFVIDGVNGTGSKNWVIGWHTNGSATNPAAVFCPNASDDNRMSQQVSQITIQELDF